MNIILLVSDTFRFDNLGERAEMPVRTPCLDAFARRAVSMTRCYASSFPTIPHRTDLTSGRVGWPWHGWQSRLASTRNHLPEMLRPAGYVSQLLCDCPHLVRADFDKGFDAAHQIRGQEGDVWMLHMNDPIPEVMPEEKTRTSRHFRGSVLPNLSRWINPGWRGEEDRFAPRTARTAVRWLEENYAFDPFLLWVDWFDPHEPWDPPEYLVRRYDPKYRATPMIHPNYGRSRDLTRAERRNLRAHYAAEAEMVDRWVGRVIEKIDDLGLWENSVVLFTSDHGMSLGEHGRTGKSNISAGDERLWPLYPEVAHVPCLVAAPGVEGGREVAALVQSHDLLPTLLDLAGVKAAPPEPMHGRSFAHLVRGTGDEPLRDVAVCGSFLRLSDEGAPPARKAVTPMAYADRWAYAPLGASGRPELYDLRRDPYATRDVAKDHPGVVRRMHRSLLDYLSALSAPPEARAVFE